ncbi:DUF1847 domain-containing protein [Clostridioides difficile]
MGLKREMQTVQKIFEHHGFEVFSVICKMGQCLRAVSYKHLRANETDS